MADGLCSADALGNGLIEKTLIIQEEFAENRDTKCDASLMAAFYLNNNSDSDKVLFTDRKLNSDEGFLDDCRKKRCVDRYDSSESSDSGVAVLSCTDCSGSSTASSDITDPGSPFSTTSSHSEDSSSSSNNPQHQQSNKMPPTPQTAHHPLWPWTAEEGPPIKRSLIQIQQQQDQPQNEEKTGFSKRLKLNEDNIIINNSKQSPSCLNNNNNNTSSLSSTSKINNNGNNSIINNAILDNPSPDKLVKISNNKRKIDQNQSSIKQGKITEYFKSQIKLHVIKKDNNNLSMKNNINKFVSLVDQQTQFNGVKPLMKLRNNLTNSNNNNLSNNNSKKNMEIKNRKLAHQVTVPRKILPAPSKLSSTENLTLNHHHHHHQIANFPPTVTLTALSFPPNLTYLHTKTPKPPDNIFVPQFATTTIDNKINTIPIINRTSCLNVIQSVHHQKLTTVNNFNCVKLNATVVPIVKLNTLPSRLNGSTTTTTTTNFNDNASVETAVPTILTTKSKIDTTTTQTTVSKQHGTLIINQIQDVNHNNKSLLSLSDSDSSGISSMKDNSNIEISTNDDSSINTTITTTPPPQKSPILSQPKTIRFPPLNKQKNLENLKQKSIHSMSSTLSSSSSSSLSSTSSSSSSSSSNDSGLCRWAECNAQFDTSGALLEHLQVKHVISQATQEQYVCLWLGCKVHGRTSCSRSWLERHVLAHAGTKPFRCIVDGCGQRFNSQLALERHVNNHFNSDGNQNGNTKKSTEEKSSKLFKRNGKKIRFRRQPWSARMFDFIDSGIMEGLQYKLLTMTENRTLGHIANNKAGNSVNVSSQIIARRVEPDGGTKFLVKWHPADIVPDEWVPEKEYVSTKVVPIPAMNMEAKDTIHSCLFPVKHLKQKQRRKPISLKQQKT